MVRDLDVVELRHHLLAEQPHRDDGLQAVVLDLVVLPVGGSY
jgi:hypothetical protein